MPSHIKEKMLKADFVVPVEVTKEDIEGNDWADELAGIAAKYAELPLSITTPIIYHKNLATRIQKRHVAILCSLPDRVKHVKNPKAVIPFDSILDLCNSSQHTIYEPDEHSLACSRCKATVKRHSPALKHWLRGICLSIGSAIDRPIPLQQEFIHIGKLNIHHTHNTYKYQDTYFCMKCGFFARTKIRNLASRCEAPTVAGSRFLINIRKGILPSSGYMYSRLPSSELLVLNQLQSSVDAAAHAISVPVPDSPIVVSSPSPDHSDPELPFSPFAVEQSDSD